MFVLLFGFISSHVQCLSCLLYGNVVHFIVRVFVPEGVVLPEKPKLKFLNKVPNLKKAKKESKKLRDIQGPTRGANAFTSGQYAIVVRAFMSADAAA